jgi:hypothetical protein
VPGAFLFRDEAYLKGKGAQARVVAFQKARGTRGGLGGLNISRSEMLIVIARSETTKRSSSSLISGLLRFARNDAVYSFAGIVIPGRE